MKFAWLSKVDFAPDGTSFIITNTTPADIRGPRGKSETWMADVQTGRKLWDFETSFAVFDRLGGFPYSPDGQMLVAGHAENNSAQQEIQATRTGKTIRKLPPIFGSSSFAPDGNFLYCLDENSILWKMRVR